MGRSNYWNSLRDGYGVVYYDIIRISKISGNFAAYAYGVYRP